MGLHRQRAQRLPDEANFPGLLTGNKIETEAIALLVNEACLPLQGQGQVQHRGLARALSLEVRLVHPLSIQTFRVYQILVQMELRRQLPQPFGYVIPLLV